MNRVSDPRGRDSILHESSQAHDRDGQNFAQPPTPPPGDAAWLAFTPLSRIFGKHFWESPLCPIVGFHCQHTTIGLGELPLFAFGWQGCGNRDVSGEFR